MKDFIETLKQQKIYLKLKNDDLEVIFQTDELKDSDLQSLRANKTQLIQYLKTYQTENDFSAIPAIPRLEHYPLSASQNSIWLTSQFDKGSAAYHSSAIYVINKQLDIDAFELAIQGMIGRHEVLRTTFKTVENGEVRQFIADLDDFKYDYKYVSLKDGNVTREDILREIFAPFDLENGALIRSRLIQNIDGRYVLAFNIHHIISDGWSLNILFNELLQLYTAYTSGVPHNLPQLRVQYKNYAVWEIEQLKGEKYRSAQQYWKQQFEGEIPVLNIPTDFVRPVLKSYNGGNISVKIPETTVKNLKSIAQEMGGTLFMGIMAAVNVLLNRYSQQDDIIIGSPVSGRNHVDLENQIGCYVNAIPFRTRFDAGQSFREVFSLTRKTCLDAFNYQYYPFENLIADLNLDRDPGRSPLFDVFIVLQNTNLIKMDTGNSDEISVLKSNAADQHTSRYDLGFEFKEEAGYLNAEIEFNSDLFRRDSIERLARYLQQLIDAAVNNPDVPVSQLAYLTSEDKGELLAFNKKSLASPSPETTVLDLLSRTVKANGKQTAIVFKDQKITYNELDCRSNLVASHLLKLGAVSGTKILLIADRSIEMITGMLGIMKAGAIYVPVDPDYPLERLLFVIKDTEASYVLTTSSCIEKIPDGDFSLVDLDALDWNMIGVEDFDHQVLLTSPAYIIYTSGSSGLPKGVLVNHGSLANFCKNVQSRYKFSAGMGMPLVASNSFDISLFQMFTPLLAGGRCIIVDKEQMKDQDQLIKVLKQVSVFDTVPGVYSALLKHIGAANERGNFHHIERLFVGGDTIQDELLIELSAVFPHADITVTYGPTENTIFCTDLNYSANSITAGIKGSAIGRPLPGCEVYILSNELQLMPVGVDGEICLGGKGLSQGYLNRGDLNNEKFIDNPFMPGERLYRTGDLGKWLPDGTLEFRGRNDDQVKIRGFRIELSEIENQLKQHESIADAAVITALNGNGEKFLAGFYVQKQQVQVWPSISEYLGYNEIAYYAMNKDELRAGCYIKAIQQNVKGKVVVDVGTGPEAILAQHCLQAGAQKVYAIEILDEIYQMAKQRIELLGLQDRIIVIHGDVADVELPEQVDYCVCALVGNLGSSDGCISIMNNARRFLKDPKCMIPYRSLTHIAAISIPESNFDLRFTETGSYYINSIFEKEGAFDLRIGLKNVSEKHLISTSDVFEDLDLTAYMPLENEHPIQLKITADGYMNGFLAWLNLYTSPHILNDIFKSQESFLPIYFPVFDHKLAVKEGDLIEAIVWREVAEDEVYPDYGVKGKVTRQGETLVSFNFVSKRHPGKIGINEFYRQIFPDGQHKVVSFLSPVRLGEYLGLRLPVYMLPVVIKELAILPLTLNGKVDRQALRDMLSGADVEKDYEAPAGYLEEKLSQIFGDILGLGKVGATSNFFELGGHSLLGTRVVSQVRRELDTELSIRELFARPTVRELGSYLQSTGRISLSPLLTRQERPARVPLSYSQERLWFIDRLGGSLSYHISSVLRLTGDINAEYLEKAFRTIVARHEALRTVIIEEEGEAFQEQLSPSGWHLEHVETSGTGLIGGLLNKAFDLSSDYMLRASLVAEQSGTQVLVITLHHIASDGWSSGILMRELTTLYQGYVQGEDVELPELSVQYADYSIWQRNWLQGRVLKEKLSYWEKKLAGVGTLELPTDHPRPAMQSSRGKLYQYRLTKALERRLNALSLASGVTLFMTLLSAFKVLLYRYSGQDDISVGSPVAGRQQSAMEDMIGFFVNMVCLRSDLGGNPAFSSLLQQIKETTIAAYDHQDVPFEKVVDAVSVDRQLSRSPLFQAVFVLQNAGEGKPSVKLAGIGQTEEEVAHDTAKFELTFTVIAGEEGLLLGIEYSTDLYEPATIARMAGHYETLLLSITANAETGIKDLALLPAAESAALLSPLEAAETGYPETATIISLFREQVAQHGQRTALSYGTESLSYRELEEKSNRLGHYLQEQGVGPESLVPLCLERGTGLIIGMLGILKAGGAYVPVDPDYPADRISYMLKDTGSKVIIISSENKEKLHRITEAIKDTGIGIKTINIDEAATAQGIDQQAAGAPVLQAGPDNAAYVIYTSGSTGQPKGVVIEHRNVVRLFKTADPLYDFTPADVWTLFHSASFDFSVWEIYGALLYGGRLVIVPRETTRDAEAFAELLSTAGVTVLNQTPSAFYVLQDHLAHSPGALAIRYVIFGGEALNPEKLKPWKARYPESKLINMYGITETTVHVTYQELGITELSSSMSMIGVPIPTLGALVLDESGNLSPVGVPGELYIYGAGLARGYLNQEKLTGEKFITREFTNKITKRLYRTGDKARWRTSGGLEYHGRLDDQVKIRGYRIELGEIESRLHQSGQVKEGVVVVRTDEEGGKQLISYIVPGENYTAGTLQSYLKAHLPEYMVPALVVTLEEIPLTRNGKVNKKALPDAGMVSLGTDGYTAPGTATEIKLANIWQSLLGIERIGIDDDFFMLGGDSIRVIRLIALMKKEFNQQFNTVAVYTAPTIAQMAALVTNQIVQPANTDLLHESIVADIDSIKEAFLANYHAPQLVADVYPMSDIQKGMVYASLKDPLSAIYHDQMVYQLSTDIDVAVFNSAFELLVQKHEILRTAFFSGTLKGIQVVYKNVPVTIHVFDISNKQTETTSAFIKTYLDDERAKPFKMDEAALWRASLFKLVDGTVFIFQCHHSILDGWSVASLNTELNNIYFELLIGNEQYVAEPLKCSHKDAIVESMVEKTQDTSIDFWKKELSDYKRLKIFTPETINIRKVTEYKKVLLLKLKEKAAEDNISLKSIFLGAYTYLLSMLNYEQDITIGLVSNVRPSIEDGDKLLGCFLNTVPFRLKLSDQLTWAAYFKTVENKLQEIKKKDRSTLFEIARAIGEKSTSENPFFDTIFNYVDFHIYDDLLFKTPAGEEPADNDGHDLLDYSTTNTLLDFDANVTDGKLSISISLRKKLASGKSADGLLFYFDKIIENYLYHDDRRISNSDILLDEQQLLKARQADEHNENISDFLFNEHLFSSLLSGNEAIAIKTKENELTYGALLTSVKNLSGFLSNHLKLVKGDKVVVLVSRSAEMIIAPISVLRLGLVYVPVDVNYPAERIDFIINDVKPAVVLTEQVFLSRLNDQGFAAIVLTDALQADSTVTSEDAQLTADEPAYIIYTSGSTGLPKGVLVTHGNLNNYFAYIVNNWAVEKVIMPFLASNAFDISLFQMFTPLLSGGRCMVVNTEELQDLDQFIKIIEQVTVLDTVPGLYNALISHMETYYPGKTFTNLSNLFIGGDMIPDKLLTNLLKVFKGSSITVTYGPTEGTVFCTAISYSGNIDTDIKGSNIGEPITNTSIYILNENMELMPAGTKGEICLAGASVSKGYYNRPELSADKFINGLPFLNGPLYRTGDMGRWLPNGQLEFIGRNDGQVKIRGYRIELGEIQSILMKSTMLQQALILLKDDKADSKSIAAYIIAGQGYDKNALLTFAKLRLPEYMLPAVIVELDSFPLTTNGKIDREALLAQALGNETGKSPSPPVTAQEIMIAQIWKQLLGVDEVQTTDNFFELGGHSLLITSLIAALRKEADVEITIRDIFANPTVNELSTLVIERTLTRNDFEESTGAAEWFEKQDMLLPALSDGNMYNITHQQYKEAVRYYITNLNGFNLNFSVEFEELDKQVLEKVITTLFDRHESMRTVYKRIDGKIYQYIHDGVPPGYETVYYDLTGEADKDAALFKIYAKTTRGNFNFENGPLVNIAVVDYAVNRKGLIFNISHSISDARSLVILQNEFEALYRAFKLGHENPLPTLSLQYKDYAYWVESFFNSEKGRAAKLAYLNKIKESLDADNGETSSYRQHLKAELDSVLKDKNSADFEDAYGRLVNLNPQRGGRYVTYLSSEVLNKVKHGAMEIKSTVFMTLIATFAMLYHQISNKGHSRIYIPFTNRVFEEFQQVVGWLTGELIICIELEKELSIRDFIVSVTENVLETSKYRFYPNEQIMNDLDVTLNRLAPVFLNLVVSTNVIKDFTPYHEEGSGHFDLSCNLVVHSNGISLNIDYNTNVYTPGLIEQIFARYTTLLQNAFEDIDMPVGALLNGRQ